MSVTRCACPSCRRTFGVPDDVMGKTAKCPGCGAALVVNAIGGQTTLSLTGTWQRTPTAPGTGPCARPPTDPAPLPPPAAVRRPLPVEVSAPPDRRRRPAGRCLLLALLLLVPVLGLGAGTLGLVQWGRWTAEGQPPGDLTRTLRAGSGLAPGLTEEQRVAWEKVRAQYPDHPGQMFVYKAPDRLWRPTTYVLGSGLYHIGWGYELGDPELDQSAVRMAARTDVSAAVVLDMFSAPAPRVLRWYYSDGKNILRSQEPPSAALGSSLDAHLHQLQVHASSLTLTR